MSDNNAHVSGRTIFIITKNIAAPSYWELKVYADLKSLMLRLESVVREFLIDMPIILDLRLCWAITAYFAASSYPDA